MTPGERTQQVAEPLLRAAFGAQSAQVLYVAAKLGIADQLRVGPASAVELAGLLCVDASALERILRGLVALGACEELHGSRFGLTPIGQHLRIDHPDSVVPRVILNVEVHHALWNDLLATVKTGESASDRVFGGPFYEHLSKDHEAGALFDRAMTGGGWIQHRLLPAVEAYDFGKFRSIADIGGGNGSLMVETLKAYPKTTGIVFDVPRLAPVAHAAIAAAGLTQRCDFVAGDAFDMVPGGHDAYVLSNFVNSFSDDDVLVILRNCHNAISSDGKLLMLEWVLGERGSEGEGFRYWDTVTMDLVMLAAFGSHGGRLRTRSQFESLLQAAGFAATAFIPTRASIYVIEAAPTSALSLARDAA